jgi:hypothetical protein
VLHCLQRLGGRVLGISRQDRSSCCLQLLKLLQHFLTGAGSMLLSLVLLC